MMDPPAPDPERYRDAFDVRGWVAAAIERDRVDLHLLSLPPAGQRAAVDRLAPKTHAYVIGGSVWATVTETTVQAGDVVLCRLLELRIRGRPAGSSRQVELPADRAVRF